MEVNDKNGNQSTDIRVNGSTMRWLNEFNKYSAVKSETGEVSWARSEATPSPLYHKISFVSFGESNICLIDRIKMSLRCQKEDEQPMHFIVAIHGTSNAQQQTQIND